MFDDVCGLCLVDSHLSSFNVDRLGQAFCYLLVSYFFSPIILSCQHGV